MPGNVVTCADLYERMKAAPLEDLSQLALERYTATGLQPLQIEAADALEAFKDREDEK